MRQMMTASKESCQSEHDHQHQTYRRTNEFNGQYILDHALPQMIWVSYQPEKRQ